MIEHERPPKEILVEFPVTDTYAKNLGHLRKILKPHIRDLDIRRRPTGVLLRGSPGKLASALLIMPTGYSVRDIQ